MRVTLYIPGLLERTDQLSPRASSLQALLARTSDVRSERDGAIALLAPVFGVARQQDWPLAPLRARALGLDAAKGYWLRVWPVHLEAGLDDVRVQSAVGDVDNVEAEALLADLSKHFRDDGLAFVRGTRSEWFLAVQAPPQLMTRPLRTALGQRLRPYLPTGDDAPQWRRWSQEVEMMLHTHPVNETRERDGRTTVNALWYEYGGVLPAGVQHDVTALTDIPDAQALAGTDAATASADGDSALRDGNANDVVITTPLSATMEDIDARYAAGVLRALNSGRAERALVIVDGQGMPALAWEPRRTSWIQRLRTSRISLADAFASALEQA